MDDSYLYLLLGVALRCTSLQVLDFLYEYTQLQ